MEESLEFSFQEFGSESLLAKLSVENFARHPALASIAIYSPYTLARLIDGAYRSLSSSTSLYGLRLPRWPRDDSQDQDDMLAEIFNKWADWITHTAACTPDFWMRMDRPRILTAVFYCVVSILYRANDLLDTFKVVNPHVRSPSSMFSGAH